MRLPPLYGPPNRGGIRLDGWSVCWLTSSQDWDSYSHWKGIVAESTALRVAALGFAGAVGFASAVALREDLPAAALGLKIPLSVPTGLVVGLGWEFRRPGQCQWRRW